MTDAWLYQRLVADRRRLLEPSLRARAALALAEDFIEARVRTVAVMRIDDSDEKVAAEEAKLVQRRSTFVSLMRVVERLASDLYVVGYRRGPVVSVDDDRIIAIRRFCKIAAVDERAVDDATWALVQSQRRGLEACATYMATLPVSVPRVEPRPSPRSRKRHPNYDGSALLQVVSLLPDGDLYGAEQLELERRLLGDLDEHLRAEAPIDDGRAGTVRDSPTRRAALLRAATEVYDAQSAAQRAAVKAKSKALASHPSGRARVAYSARSTDLDAELIQPIREVLEEVRELVIRYAARVAPSSSWPLGNTQLDRALALGRALVVEDVELATARAALGYASMGVRAR